jgi:hypothetical protein
MSTTQQEGSKGNNPTGKGGFGDHPEHRNPGGWRKEVSFSYQYKRFMSMSVADLKKYADTPESNRTVVEDLAYSRVIAAKKSLPDIKEIADRTEGKPQQSVDVTSNGETLFGDTSLEITHVRPNDKDTTQREASSST